MDSVEYTSYQKQRAYDHSTSSNEESRLSSRHGKEPAKGRPYTKKINQNRRAKELKGVMIVSINLYIHVITGHKRKGSEESNSDGYHSFIKHKNYSKGSDSSLYSN